MTTEREMSELTLANSVSVLASSLLRVTAERDAAERDLRALEWLVSQCHDYRMPDRAELPLVIYDEESGEDVAHPTYAAAALALGWEDQ